MTEEQELEEFWEWYGWSWWEAGSCYCFGESDISRELPPIDLNNLFKYAVPVLFCMGLQTHLASMSSTHYITRITDAFGKHEDIVSMASDPAQALYRALREVMKNDKD